ncbi:hypothetical protein [robinz microvirus RP_103]|nr:hypothetical protein [robinz microvirus RP_103]
MKKAPFGAFFYFLGANVLILVLSSAISVRIC